MDVVTSASVPPVARHFNPVRLRKDPVGSIGTSDNPPFTHFCLPYFRRGTWSVTPDRFSTYDLSKHNLGTRLWHFYGVAMTSPLPRASGVEAIRFHTSITRVSKQFISPCHEIFLVGFRRDLAPMAIPYRIAIHV